jgi:YVTN family beta-propeller protein
MNTAGSVHGPEDRSPEQEGTTRRAMSPALIRGLGACSLLIAGLGILSCGGGSDITGPAQVATVTVTPAASPLASIGQTVQLSVTAADSAGHSITVTGSAVTWSSSNTAAATVSATGLVTATGNGNSTISATVAGVMGTATVSVAQVVTSVAVTPGASTLVSLGATAQLTGTPQDANGNPVPGQTVIWSSSNNGIATVSPAGLVTAVANGGPVTITATVGTLSGTATATVAQAVATVGVTPPITTLASLGSTVQLAAAPQDANGNPVTGASVTWSSSDNAIALVGPTGLVTAMATGGPVTVTATAGGKSGTATVTVAQAVAAVAVTPPTTTLVSFGETLQLNATATDANGMTVSGLPVAWLSSNPAVATVSTTGLVTAVANGGPVTFTATIGGKSGTATVTVQQHVNSITVTPDTTTLVSLGATVQLLAALQDANGNPVPGMTVTWSSSNTGVATVDAAGLVLAVANGGPVTFTATAGGKSGTATVTVAQVVTSVAVTPPATTLVALGSTVQLSAVPQDARGNPVTGLTVTWSSSNAAVAFVGPTGLVTAMATGGPVTLTASAGGKSGTATVTVAQAVTTVTVTPPASTLGSIGETLQLTATATDANGTTVSGLPVTWSSSNATVASVSTTGLVTAVANGGPVTITATEGGKSGTATVTVAQVVASVDVTPPTFTLTALGATAQLTASPLDATGHLMAGAATWSSSDITIATVSASGLVTAVANGSATITATVGTKSGTSLGTVAQVAASVAITTQPSATVQSGVTFPAVPVVTVKDGTGNGIGNQIVTVSVASGGALTFTNGTATTDASGIATFTGLSAVGLIGARTLGFSVGAVQSAASNSVTIAPGLPATVTITTQPSATIQSGVTFAQVPVVTVKDGATNLVPGATVAVSVGSGGSLTFTNGSATTDGSGVATFTGLTASGLAGDRTLLFTAGTAVSAASSTVTISAGAPATVAITTQPPTAVQALIAFPTAPVVTVTDGGGNPVANQAVTVSVATGGALTFTNGSATTDGSGVATFTGLTANGTAGARTLKFTAGTAVSVPSTSVTLNAGAPDTVTITTQPAAIVQTGVLFPTVPVVKVTDGGGNPVPNQAVTVSVASGAALTFNAAGTATTNSSGVATFTGLVATGTVGQRTLQFTAGTAVSPVSDIVTVNGGPPATVTIQVQPAATVQSGVIFPTVPVVTVTDAIGNPVAGQAVTISVAAGGALTFTNGSATTDLNGIATFSGLSAAGLIGARTLRFTAGSANTTTPANAVTVVAGLAKTVTITTQPSATVQNGVLFPVVPVVTVRDSTTNLVANQAVIVSVGTGSPLTFTNGTATTNSSGVATFTGLVATGAIGARTLLFTAGTAVSAASATVTLTTGAVAQIILSPATTMLLPTAASKQLTYVAQDAGGNPVSPQPALTGCTSDNTSLVTVVVNATGCLATAGATNGMATITASIGTVSATALVMNGQVAVVTNNADRTASILNGTTVQATVSVGNGPLDVAITPDGATAWVLNNNGSNINLVTLGTNVVSPNISSSNPRGISIAPAGDVAFVVRGALDPAIEFRQTSDGASLGQVPSGKSPRYVVATSTDAWIGDSGRTATNGQVMRYNRALGFVTDSIMVGMTPYGIDITPNGQRVYVANKDSNTVSVINTSTLTRIANIPVGSQPWGVKVTPNGLFVYVANSGANTVSVISTATNTVTATVTVGSSPRGLAITAAGDLVYVANSGSGTVSRIATATNTLSGSSITVGGTPSHIALRNVQ